MAVIKWNPWTFQDFMENNWDLPTIPGLSRLMGQGLNIFETKDEIIAEAAVPGVAENDISVVIDGGVVRISANVDKNKEEKDKRKYYMESMHYSYNYAFRIPDVVIDNEDPVCELDDGVLTIRFSKIQKEPPKRIAVKNKRKTASPAKTERMKN